MVVPDPSKHGNFLKRVVGSARRRRSVDRNRIPPERLERWAKWWEWHIMGLSAMKIVAREGGKYSPQQVESGLTKYAELAAEPLSRDGRLTRSVHLVDLMKTKAIDAAQKLDAEAKANGGGVPKRTERETTDSNGKVVRLQQVQYERVDREVRDWLRLALDCEKYLSTLHGILSINAGDTSDIDALDVSFDGLLPAPDERKNDEGDREP